MVFNNCCIGVELICVVLLIIIIQVINHKITMVFKRAALLDNNLTQITLSKGHLTKHTTHTLN